MGMNVGISYEVLRALAVQQGHVVVVSSEDRRGTMLVSA